MRRELCSSFGKVRQVAKILRFGRTRTNVGSDIYNIFKSVG